MNNGVYYYTELLYILFLAKLLQSEKSTLSSQMFTSVAIIDAYDVSIIQQCRMLESNTGTSVLKLCLECPEDAISIVRSEKSNIFDRDIDTSSLTHPSAHLVASVAQSVSWCHLWDLALDRGVRGTNQLQRIVYHLSRPIFSDFSCPLCDITLTPTTTWLSHLSNSHSITNGSIHLSVEEVIYALKSESVDTIFNLYFPT